MGCPYWYKRTWVLMDIVFHESRAFSLRCETDRTVFLEVFASVGDRARLLEHRSGMSADGPDLNDFELSFLSGQT